MQDKTVKDGNAAALVLASGSPRRLSLLRQIGIEPRHLHASNIDETPRRGEHPRYLAKRLAREKAEYAEMAVRLVPGLEKAVILAADTVVAVGRTILPKPEVEDEARECLRLLSGRTHKVFNAICLINAKGRQQHRMVESRVRFAWLNRKVIDTYLMTGEWHGKAGAYAIQGRAGSFVVRLVGSYTGVVGLGLAETVDLLHAQGYPVYEGWMHDHV